MTFQSACRECWSSLVASTHLKKSCWSRVCSIWATRETEETNKDQELYVKTTLRELIIYIVFLTLCCIITFSMTSTTMYYYTKVMTDLFLEKKENNGICFKEVNDVKNFYKFVQGPLLDSLFEGTNSSNGSMQAANASFIYYENKLLGVPRLRQVKVHNHSCQVHEDFHKFITDCYDSYSESSEDKESFGPKNGTAWQYFSESQLAGAGHWGKVSTYSGGGFYLDLSFSKKQSATLIKDLSRNGWIQRGTRAVFIDFSVYNANINLFCVVRLLVEFLATGGAVSSSTFRTVKLIRYVTSWDYFVMACEVMFCVFILYYTVEEILEIRRHKFAYFKNFWNILDIIVILISFVCLAFNVYRTMEVNRKLQRLLQQTSVFADFERLSYWEARFNNAVAIAVFIAWIKIFKYISFNRTMTQLSSTLARCAKDLVGFFFMFIIIFLAFTQLGYLLFGTQVKDFSSFQQSFFTLFRIILGDFDFHQLEEANRILGPMFFILFVFFVFFVLINMFLAIINDTYSQVKSDMAHVKNEFEISDYCKKRYLKVSGSSTLKTDAGVDAQNTLKQADIYQEKIPEFDEWRQQLKMGGLTDGEIEALLARVDMEDTRLMDPTQRTQVLTELVALMKACEDVAAKVDGTLPCGQGSSSSVSFKDGNSLDKTGQQDCGSKSTHFDMSSSVVSHEEFTILSRRVDQIEHSIGSIVFKIDIVLDKLQTIERVKLKRSEALGKILDRITELHGTSDLLNREQMEKLVRVELEQYDSQTAVNILNSRPDSLGSGHGSSNSDSRLDSSQNRVQLLANCL